MSGTKVNNDIEGWFTDRQLPWSQEISQALEEFGTQCVEDLKLVPLENFLQLFSIAGQAPKLVIAAKAKLAHKQLCDTKFEFHRCAKELLLNKADAISDITTFSTAAASSVKKKESPHLIRSNNMTDIALPVLSSGGMSKYGFSRKVIKTVAEIRREREERQKKKQKGNDSPATSDDTISKSSINIEEKSDDELSDLEDLEGVLT